MNQRFPKKLIAALRIVPTVPLTQRIGKWFRMAALVAWLAAGAGCSGIHASKSISILDIFMPGLMKNDTLAPANTDTVAPAEPAAPAV